MTPLKDLLSTWLATKRWCPSGGHAVAVDLVSATPLFDPGHDAVVVFHLVRAHVDSGPVLLSVPLTYRWWDPRAPRGGPGEEGKVPAPPSNDSVVGSLTLSQARELLTSCGVPQHSIPPAEPLRGPESVSESIKDVGSPPPWQGVTVRDAVFDAAFTRAWVSALLHDSPMDALHHPERDGLLGEVLTSAPEVLRELTVENPRVVTAEQSNSSAVLNNWGMVKLFRILSPGSNPDVEIPVALSRQGWGGVPEVFAHVKLRWPVDDGHQGELADVAVLTRFLPESRDGFELALRMAQQREDFSNLAWDLGHRSAQMHRMLRTAFSSDEDAGVQGSSLGTDLIDQVRWVSREVPSLADVRDDIVALGEALRGLPDLDLNPTSDHQRVHGDYHLGQVLRAGERWVVLDFEGEPLRSLAQRNQTDDPLRDVAGMLRSLDYAAAIGQTPPWWREKARQQFLSGYLSESPDSDLTSFDLRLTVHELLKALYEAVYESRSRPDWLQVPLAAIRRLTSHLNQTFRPNH